MDATLLTEEFFHGALEREGAARAEYLARLREQDPALAAEVEALLAVRAGCGASFERRPALPPLAEALEPGLRLGPYELRELVAAGGMGVVYRAARVDGAFDKDVAIKLVRKGIFGVADRPELLRRFLAERQILAQLEHPYIARLLDGGTAEDGSPFLVMELVAGQPIDHFCEERLPHPRERIDLFVRVCEAVQYAHDRFIAHRDLKPGNILVAQEKGREPLPKLLDFGIARLLGTERGAPRSDASVGSQAMTPAYASPEQFRGEVVTAASDVYSLGVVLYRLLTGALPYKLAGLAPLELARRVCELPPQRPSAHDRRIRGDLEAIVLKALEKEPARRYASAASFMDDLVRWREGRPVLARPATRAYRLRKAIGRHKLSFSLGAIVFVTLCTATIWISLLFRKARASERLADERWRESARALELFRGIFATPNPFVGSGGEPTVREAIDRVTPELLESLADQPGIRGRIRHMIASTYHGLGQLDEARDWALASVEDLDARYGPDAPDTRRARLDLVSVLLDREELDLAEEHLSKLLPIAAGESSGAGGIRAEALYFQGILLLEQGDLAASEQALREASALAKAEGAHSQVRLDALSVLGQTLLDQGRFQEARAVLEELIQLHTEVVGEDHPYTLEARMRLAALEVRNGRAREAVLKLGPIVEMLRTKLGDRHHLLLTALSELGMAFWKAGDYELAEAHLRDVLAAQQETLGEEHRDTLKTMSDLAGAIWKAGRTGEAEALLRAANEVRLRHIAATHPEALIGLSNLILLLRSAGKPEQALEELAPLVLASRATLEETELGRSVLQLHDELSAAAPAQSAPR